nr:ABC transporter ATP-binding protein [uncultured Campylobacter sp.]
MRTEGSLLAIKDAGFFYEEGKFLFRNLSFEIKRGQILAILGLNGQGKSTLMSCMMGILDLKEGQLCTQAKFGFLPQSFSVAFDYSVQDIVAMGRVRDISLFSKPSKRDVQICLDALESLEISHLKNKRFNSLSGGQKQLVLFARAIASKSEILFLDEPASALDIKNQDRVLSLIVNLKQKSNASIVFTTHQPNHALAVADRTLILKDDLSYVYGLSAEVLNEENLNELYRVRMKTTKFDIDGEQVPSITQIFSAQVR